jgi:hypothetical protein
MACSYFYQQLKRLPMFVDSQILGPGPGKTPAALPEAKNDI